MKKNMVKLFLTAAVVLAFSAASSASLQFSDTFENTDVNGFDIQDVNHPATITGISGIYDKGTNSYIQSPAGWAFNHQVRLSDELLLYGGIVTVNENLNGADSAGGFFAEVDINPARGAALSDGNWGALTIGAGGLNNVWASGFGVLFRKSGTIQVFNNGANIVSDTVTWNATPDDAYHTVKILATDAGDGNPFDGVGTTTFEIFADGSSIYSVDQDGASFANNYVSLEGSNHNNYFDNLNVQAIPEPATLGLLCFGAMGMMALRRRL